eukprot:4532796-Prorocentrum_lima.AAC.1
MDNQRKLETLAHHASAGDSHTEDVCDFPVDQTLSRYPAVRSPDLYDDDGNPRIFARDKFGIEINAAWGLHSHLMTLAIINGLGNLVPVTIETELINPH